MYQLLKCSLAMLTVVLLGTVVHGQNTVSIGSETLNQKAVLTLVSPSGDQGFILPVVPNRNVINPGAAEKGMLVYDNSASGVFLWNGSAWMEVTASGSGTGISSLNDISDVNAPAPAAGQILQFQPGTGWVAADVALSDTDNQALILTGDVLTIEDGSGSVNLTSFRQDISFNSATNELSISGGSTIIIPSGGTDADADPTNELQMLGFNATTNVLSLSDGNSVTIPSGGTDADADSTNELQDISFNSSTNELSITDGSTITLPSGGTDADADPTNEIQTISKAGSTVTLSNGGGTFTDAVNDADADPANEIQDILFNATTNELSITDGSTIALPSGGTDADADPTNEIQTISKAGSTITLSNGGGTFTDAINDADADPTNEIDVTAQNGLLIGNGTDVTGLSGTISGQVPKWNGSTWITGVDETGTAGTSLWKESSNNIYFTDGNVGIGTASPAAALHILSNSTTTGQPLRIETPGNDSYMTFYSTNGYKGYAGIYSGNNDMDFGTGAFNTTGKVHLVIQSFPRLTVDSGGNVGIGTTNPAAKLDITGGEWDLNSSEGDLRIGSNLYRLNIGVSLSGLGAGTVRIRAKGGVNQLKLGAGNNDVVTIKEDAVEVDGEVHRPSTGAANLLPIAYGNIDRTGYILTGTGNFTVSKASLGTYIITIDGEHHFSHLTYITMLTMNERSPGNVTSGSRGGSLEVYTRGPTGGEAERAFTFVIYKQ